MCEVDELEALYRGEFWSVFFLAFSTFMVLMIINLHWTSFLESSNELFFY